MPPSSKSAEDWIAFLLTLIDHTPDFKPDYNGFATSTGLYKGGKYVKQALDGLKKKHANGDFGPVGANNAGPATPSKSKAGGTPKSGSKAGNSKKRAAFDNAEEDDYDETKPKLEPKRVKKEKANGALKEEVVIKDEAIKQEITGESATEAGSEGGAEGDDSDLQYLGQAVKDVSSPSKTITK